MIGLYGYNILALLLLWRFLDQNLAAMSVINAHISFDFFLLSLRAQSGSL